MFQGHRQGGWSDAGRHRAKRAGQRNLWRHIQTCRIWRGVWRGGWHSTFTLLFLFFFICSIFPMLICHSYLTNDFLYFFLVSLSAFGLTTILILSYYCVGVGIENPFRLISIPSYWFFFTILSFTCTLPLMWHFVTFVHFTSRCITSLCYCLFHFSQLAPDIKMSLVKTIPNTDHLLRETIYCLLRKQHNFIYLFFIRVKQCVFLIRMSCWLSWMSYSRRRWREAFWRLEGQRMSTSPTCLQLRYPPEPVRI